MSFFLSQSAPPDEGEASDALSSSSSSSLSIAVSGAHHRRQFSADAQVSALLAASPQARATSPPFAQAVLLHQSSPVAVKAPASAAAGTANSFSPAPPPLPSAPVATSVAEAEELLALRKERDVLRNNVRRLQSEQQALLAQHAAERELLQERVLSLEYDLLQQRTAAVGDVVPRGELHALQTQYETLLNKCRSYELRLSEWEVWKGKAESITQDLALRLKEEQKIRRKLDTYLQEQHGIKSAAIVGSTSRPNSAPAGDAPGDRIPSNDLSINVHHL